MHCLHRMQRTNEDVMATSNKYVQEALELLLHIKNCYSEGKESVSGTKLDLNNKEIDDLVFKHKDALSWAVIALEEYIERPDEKGFKFTRISGGGLIKCVECDYTERIVAFFHGVDGCTTGYQCKSCFKFDSVDNETGSEIVSGCDCGGDLTRKRKLICPRCHSINLSYGVTVMT